MEKLKLHLFVLVDEAGHAAACSDKDTLMEFFSDVVDDGFTVVREMDIEVDPVTPEEMRVSEHINAPMDQHGDGIDMDENPGVDG